MGLGRFRFRGAADEIVESGIESDMRLNDVEDMKVSHAFCGIKNDVVKLKEGADLGDGSRLRPRFKALS